MALMWILFLATIVIVDTSHFRGGVIMWSPTTQTGNPLEVTYTFRVGWRKSHSAGIRCTEIGNEIGQGSLTCLQGCEVTGIITPLFVSCTDFSDDEDWSTGERSYTYIMESEGPFTVGFQGNDWISLETGGGGWSLVSTVNLTSRSELNTINHSPRTSLNPLVKLQHGCSHTIQIPVVDVDGDSVRCRWASGSTECAGVCNSFPNAVLDEQACIISYNATYSIGYYAVAIVLEDFSTSDSITPLSSVGLQFLVLVFTSEESCGNRPTFVDDTPQNEDCIAVSLNTTWQQSLIAIGGGSDVGITEINTVSPPGLTRSDIDELLENKFRVNITWMPTNAQLGEQIFCYAATNTIGLLSDQICIKLLVGASAPTIVNVEPRGNVVPTRNQWNLNFDMMITKSTIRSTYMNFHNSMGEVVYRVDCTGPNAQTLRPQSTVMSVTTNYRFIERQNYYITLDRGLVSTTTGVAGQCNPMSEPQRNASFWMIHIRDVTPPVITILNTNGFTNNTIVIKWDVNEEVNATCFLQTPDSLSVEFQCENEWIENNLAEGYHSLIIRATDSYGNVASKTFNWYVDITPPTFEVSGVNVVNGEIYVNATRLNVRLVCSERYCTFEYHIWLNSTEVTSGIVNNGLLPAQDFNSEETYLIIITAIDQVGNRNQPTTYTLITDTTKPILTGIPESVVIECSDNLYPNNTNLGTPDVLDDNDITELRFEDVVSDGCSFTRKWFATDQAGNIGMAEQSISISNNMGPVIDISPSLVVPCNQANNLIDPEEQVRKSVTITHPCNRSYEISTQDTADSRLCGITFERVWTVTDDCGVSTSASQTIQILQLTSPLFPSIGQENVDIYETLQWDTYQASFRYDIYIWEYGNPRPDEVSATTTSPQYRNSDPFPQSTQILWQIEFYVPGQNQTIPSPLWGFQTRSYPDLSVTSIIVPDFAFSGGSIGIQYTVENIGGANTAYPNKYGYVTRAWSDYIYMGTTKEWRSSRYVGSIYQERSLDSMDGYSSEFTIDVRDDELGIYFVHVFTDRFGRLNEIVTENNEMASGSGVEIRLTPPPNLVVESLIVPSSTFSGQPMNIRYVVKNVGPGNTRTNTWYDRILLHDNVTLDAGEGTLLSNQIHRGKLASGEDYVTSAEITISNRIFGNFYIYVQTDIYNWVYEHIAENDNVVRAEALEVILSPPADLVVTSVTYDNAWETGSIVTLNYTVSNQGGGPTYESYWRDSVILVDANERRYFLFEKPQYRTLQPSGSYIQSQQLTVSPEWEDGVYTLEIKTNIFGHVFEYQATENNLYETEIEISQKLPDLMIESFTYVLEQNTTFAYINVSIGILNTGIGRTLANRWTDRLWFEHSNRDFLLMSYLNEEITIIPGGYYNVSNVISIPDFVFGNAILKYEIDRYRSLVETSTSNNLATIDLTFPQVVSDFRIDNLVIDETSIVGGTTVTVQWMVSNIGNKDVTGDKWLDVVYVQSNDVRIKVAEQEIGQHVLSGATYESALNATMPDTISGEMMIVVVVNNNRDIYETDNSNNEENTTVSISVPPSPDFSARFVEFTYYDRNRIMDITWEVKNEGNTMEAIETWLDHIFLFPTSNGANITLQTESVTARLPTLQSYTKSIQIHVPQTIIGEYKVGIFTDSANQIKEYNAEGNNKILSSEVVLFTDLSKIGIGVTLGRIPTVAIQGETLRITYTVEMERRTFASSWTDSVYIYASGSATFDDVIADGFKLGSFLQTSGNVRNNLYIVSENVRIPFGVFSSDMYVYVVPDETGTAGFVSKVSNVVSAFSSNATITLQLGPVSDLTWAEEIAPIVVIGGQPFEIEAKVKNIGQSNIESQVQIAMYLSVDDILDPFDLRIANVKPDLDISINETVILRIMVDIPFDQSSGIYFLISILDTVNAIYELDETNNYAISKVNMTETVSTDIAISSVSMSSQQWTYGEGIDIQWQLQNLGAVTAIGYKCDTAYMSSDAKWDIYDQQVGDSSCIDINLDPYNSSQTYIENNLAATIPLLLPGEYYALVRSRTNIKDPDLSNNIMTTTYPEEINLPGLILDDLLSGVELTAGQRKAYIIRDVPVDETLLITLTSEFSAFTNVYCKYDEPATAYDFDGTSLLRNMDTQTTVIERTYQGNYYVLIENEGSTATAITILAKLATFEIFLSAPSVSSNQGFTTFHVEGTLFERNMSARLFNQYQEASAIETYFFDSTTLYARFDLKHLIAGQLFSLELRYENSSTTALLDNAVRIVFGSKGTLTFLSDSINSLAVGTELAYRIDFSNTGDTDLDTEMLYISSTGPGNIYLIENGQTNVFSGGFVMAAADQGPAGILPPGGYGSLHFKLSQDLEPIPGRMSLSVSRVNSDLPNIFQALREDWKPYTMPESVWEELWSNFVGYLGNSARETQTRMNNIMNGMSIAGHRSRDVLKLLQYTFAVVDGRLTGDRLIRVQDTDFSRTAFSLELTLVREYSTVFSKRRMLGPFGYGWHMRILELKIITIEDDYILLYKDREEVAIPMSFEDFEDEYMYLREQDMKYSYHSEGITYVFDATTYQLELVEYDNETMTIQRAPAGNRIMSLRHSSGPTLDFTYSTDDLILQAVHIADGRSQTIFYEYSDNELLSVVTDSTSLRYEYQNHDLVSEQYDTGAVTEYSYNERQQISRLETFHPSGETASRWIMEYTEDAQLIMHQWPENSATKYTFDVHTNLIAIDSANRNYNIKRDQAGIYMYLDDKLLRHLSYNEQKREFVLLNGNEAKTSYALNEDGSLASFTDGNGNVLNAAYEKDVLSSITFPDQSTEKFHYDQYNRMVSYETRAGESVEYDYNADESLSEKIRDSVTTIYDYDTAGRLVNAANDLSSIEFTYSGNGLPQTVRYDGDTTIRYEYSKLNRLSSMSHAEGGFNVSYVYNSRGRLHEVKLHPQNKTILTLEYMDGDYLSKRIYGNGATTSYEYVSSTKQIKNIIHRHNNGTVIASYEYVYDRLGNVAKMITLDGEWTMRYDPASQLTFWSSPDGSQTLAYDKNGNRIRTDDGTNVHGYVVNNLNQYTSSGDKDLGYDLNGNVIEEINRYDNTSSTYTYDTENKMTSLRYTNDICNYTYDAIENLRSRNCLSSGSVHYYMDPFSILGQTVFIQKKTDQTEYYVNTEALGIIARVINNDVHYFHHDAIGSVVAVLDDFESLVASYEYDPFGNVLKSEETIQNEMQYVGQWGVLRQPSENQAAIYWMRTRFYQANYGRYMSVDTLGVVGKSPNWYIYVGNNPTLYVDPTGRILPAFIAGAALVGAIVNTHTYIMSTDFSDPKMTLGQKIGGIASAAVTGGVSAALTFVPGGLAAKVAVGAAEGAINHAITQGLTGQSVTAKGLFSAALEKGIWSALPIKLPGFGPKTAAAFGKTALKRGIDKAKSYANRFINEYIGALDGYIKGKISACIKAIRKCAGDIFDPIKDFLKDFLDDVLDDLGDFFDDLFDDFFDWIQSIDPNDIIGPKGFGEAHFISASQVLPYKIRFENDENATAPAQKVTIEHGLDDDLDLRTFRLGHFGFGNFTFELDYTRAVFQQLLDFTDERGFVLSVRAGLNIVSKSATWTFETIDPETGYAPIDASIGFLPPNNGSTGEGFVTYQIKAKQDAQSGSRIDAVASIIFDRNEAIETPPIFNTIDNDMPSVNISINDELLNVTFIELNFSDNTSGVQSTDIYLVEDDDQYVLLQSEVKDQVMTIPPNLNGTVKLAASTVDNVGNRAVLDDAMFVEVTIERITTTPACRVSDCNGNGYCSDLGFCICFDGFSGIDCQDEGQIQQEPPILEASVISSIEDRPVVLNLQVRPATRTDTNQLLSMQLLNIPDDIMVNGVMPINNSIIIEQEDFGRVLLRTPMHYSGSISIDIVGYVTEATIVSRTGSLDINVMAVADTPSLSITRACYDDETIQVSFDSQLTDTDGSESLQVLMQQVPISAFIPPALATLDIPNGYYQLSPNAVTEGSISFSIMEFEPFELKVMARAVESSNNNMANSSWQTVIIDTCGDGCAIPTFSNGMVSCTETTTTQAVVGEECHLVCNTGYNTDSSSVTCGTSGLFEPQPYCTAITCAIPTITNGNIQCNADDISYEDECIILCDDGYETEVTQTICGADGGFVPVPTCTELLINCTDFCENGGSPVVSNNRCTCNCLPEWQGETCVENKAQLSISIEMTVRAPFAFWQEIWIILQRVLSTAINTLCRSEIEICCPGASNDTELGGANYIEPTNVILSSPAKEVIRGGISYINFAFFVFSDPENQLCQLAYENRRMKRQINDMDRSELVENALNQSLVLSVIASIEDEINTEIEECCNATLVDYAPFDLDALTTDAVVTSTRAYTFDDEDDSDGDNIAVLGFFLGGAAIFAVLIIASAAAYFISKRNKKSASKDSKRASSSNESKSSSLSMPMAYHDALQWSADPTNASNRSSVVRNT